jgi:hypothetical protein
MHITKQKEQYSIAYFSAVAAVAKLKLFRCDVDDESIDITVGRTGGDGTLRSPRLDVQLKCSAQELLKPDGVHLPLKRKNYDDLRRTDCHVPHILVVLLVPEDPVEWCVNIAEREMCLRQNAWWRSLAGAAENAGVDTPTVILPRGQLFHPAALSGIMDRVGRREPL